VAGRVGEDPEVGVLRVVVQQGRTQFDGARVFGVHVSARDIEVEMRLLRPIGLRHCGVTWLGASWKARRAPLSALMSIQSSSVCVIGQPVSSE
jgi:hypothetical protein